MALIGIDTNRNNPSYTIDDFTFWIPRFSQFMKTEEGLRYFNKLYPIANNKIFYSIYGTDWEYAMSLCIAHYMYLISSSETRPTGNSLAEASGNGGTITGVLTSVSVGGFSKSYDYGKTMVDSEEAMFWNQSSYGASLMALYKQKAVASILVVTNGNPYERHN